jgi:hypothetical protein
MKEGENPPVGLILCAGKGAAEARYALDNLLNKVLAVEYQTVLPNEKLIVEGLERSTEPLRTIVSPRRQPDPPHMFSLVHTLGSSPRTSAFRWDEEGSAHPIDRDY